MLLTFIDHDPPMQWLCITILHILLTIKHDDIQCSLWWYEQHGTITDHMKWQRQNVEQNTKEKAGDRFTAKTDAINVSANRQVWI